jgi:TetR/AcrR family acrAB operon transcriptional repressor
MEAQARRARRGAPELRRAEILDAAMRCFADAGYERTTVDDIAARARLSKGAIYWHFEGGKRAMFLALLHERLTRSRDLVVQAAEGGARARDSLERMLDASRQILQQELPLAKLTIEYMAHAGRDPELREGLQIANDAVTGAFIREIERGISAKEFRPVDPELATLAIDAMLDGLMINKLLRPELDLERALQVAQQLWLEGLRP